MAIYLRGDGKKQVSLMMSWCGHVKTLVKEWVIERMDEEHQKNMEREQTVALFWSVGCPFWALFIAPVSFITKSATPQWAGGLFKRMKCKE